MCAAVCGRGARHRRPRAQRELQQVPADRQREHRQRAGLAADRRDVQAHTDVRPVRRDGHRRRAPDQGDDAQVLRGQVRRLDRPAGRLGELSGARVASRPTAARVTRPG